MVVRRITDLIFRIIVGIVFVFSGFVKAVDPLGSAYKFTDYFEAFGVDFFSPLALVLSMVIPAIEFMLGFALLFNFLKKFVTWILIAFVVYFTGLTLIIAITNPISDCGCFGDAIKLSNWNTFYKNIVLLAMAVFLVLNNHRFPNLQYALNAQRIGVSFFFLFSMSISVYSYYNMPLMDFRPYKLGNNIYNQMSVPENAPQDVYETVLFYEKNGVVKEFSETNYPWQDSTWNFVDMKSELISKGYEPEIQNFNILNDQGDDIGLDIILNKDYQYIIITENINAIKPKAIEKIGKLDSLANLYGFNLFMVSSSASGDNKRFSYNTHLDIPVYNADDVLLKAIIRANPGLIVLKDGTIVGKFNLNRLEVESPVFNILTYSLSQQRMVENRYKILTLGLIFFILILGYLNLNKKYKF